MKKANPPESFSLVRHDLFRCLFKCQMRMPDLLSRRRFPLLFRYLVAEVAPLGSSSWPPMPVCARLDIELVPALEYSTR